MIFCQQRFARPLIFLCAYSAVLAPLVVARGDDSADLAAAASQFDVFFNSGRYRDCEQAAKKMQSIVDGSFPNNKLLSALCLKCLASAYHHQGRNIEAEPILRQALDIYEKAHGPEHAEVAACLDPLAKVMSAQARYQEAESLCKRSLTIHEKTVPPNDAALAESLRTYGMLYFEQRRYAEAEPLLKRSLVIREKLDDRNLVSSLGDLAMLYHWQGRYAEAEPLYQRAVTLDEKNLGSPTPYVLENLAGLYNDLGKYAEAEALYRRATAEIEKRNGSDSLDMAITLNNLASFYDGQDRWQEAEALRKRSLAIREKRLPADHPHLARSLDALAKSYASRGRYAEAEPLFKRALAIREKAFGLNNLDVADSLLCLAITHGNQGRFDEAIALAQRALPIQEQFLGLNHDDVAQTLGALATWHSAQSRHAEAEGLAKRALAIDEQVFGREHADVARRMTELARLYQSQKKYDKAEPLFQKALAIFERALGPEHTDVGNACLELADLLGLRDRLSEAEPLADRALNVLERRRADPHDRRRAYSVRGRLAWELGRRAEAIDDLEQALDLAEAARGQIAGGEQERAQFFGHFSEEFEQMVAWQTELGDAGRALAAIERGRARSLLDEMNLGCADLQAGRSAAEREQLQERERDLKSRVAALERKATIATDPAERSRLETELAQSRQELYDHYRDQRAGSPVYRNLLSVGGRPPRLSQLQRALVGDDGLLLVYLLGANGGYLVSFDAHEARATALTIDAASAARLQVDEGPLTAERTSAICSNEKHTGVLDLLSRTDTAAQAVVKLAALWNVLIPEANRAAILSGKMKRLIVAPDGPLALVPFEALVVEQNERPRYLLDAGPPVLYAPSATVLYNLSERPDSLSRSERSTVVDTAAQPVLTVAHPLYGNSPQKQPASSSMPELAARGRYRSVGGTLAELPYTATESSWVAEAFKKQQIAVAALREGLATEANVRGNTAGRRVLHLACHGLADQAYGNFFGCLALTPGTKAASDPADDGFLTLPEIYELNLKSCDLAILSACQTNYGPQQKGEGVWAISRGFLVAGARRVVASNWLVDDEAAASLISVFCSELAQAEGTGETPDYAAALHRAKRWVRKQGKWTSPYYWGTFVLVGPN